MKGLLAALLAFVAACALYASCAHAEPVQFDCPQLAVVIQNAAQLRDLGANLDKVLDLGRRNSGLQGPRWAILERELRRLWKAGQSADRAAQDVYRRCQAQLGDMGRDG